MSDILVSSRVTKLSSLKSSFKPKIKVRGSGVNGKKKENPLTTTTLTTPSTTTLTTPSTIVNSTATHEMIEIQVKNNEISKSQNMQNSSVSEANAETTNHENQGNKRHESTGNVIEINLIGSTLIPSTSIAVPTIVDTSTSLSKKGTAIIMNPTITTSNQLSESTLNQQQQVQQQAEGESTKNTDIELPEILDLDQATMAQLIKHRFTQGKLSARETARLAELKLKKLAKKKDLDDVASINAGSPVIKQGTPTLTANSPIEPPFTGPSSSSFAPVPSRSMPKLILVNGELVVDKHSLQIATDEKLNEDDAGLVEEDVLYFLYTLLYCRLLIDTSLLPLLGTE